MESGPSPDNLQTLNARPPRATWQWVTLLLVVLAVRGGVVAGLYRELEGDTDNYREIAQQMWHEERFAMSHRAHLPAQITAYRPPLYPLVLAPLQSLADDRWAIAVLHLLLGVGTALGVMRLSTRWGMPYGVGLAAALLVVVDPLLVNLSVRVLTETLAAFLAVMALLALTRATERETLSSAAWAGVWVGLCALCRPTFLIWLAMTAVILPWVWHGTPRCWRRTAAFAMAGAIVLLPWIARNQAQFGRPIASTTHGGYTLLLGNNPSFYAYLRSAKVGDVWDPLAFFLEWESEQVFVETAHGPVMDELASDRRAYGIAQESIRAEPGLFVRACLTRLGWLWGVLPHQTEGRESPLRRGLRYSVALFYTIELLLAAVGLWSLSRVALRHGWIWGLLLAISFSLVHTLFWTDMRMRAPLMGVVCLLAARGAWMLASTKPVRNLFGSSHLSPSSEG